MYKCRHTLRNWISRYKCFLILRKEYHCNQRLKELAVLPKLKRETHFFGYKTCVIHFAQVNFIFLLKELCHFKLAPMNVV